MSFGKSSGKSKVITWKDLLTPWQIQGQREMSPLLTKAGLMGIQGYGITPEERARQTAMLSGSIADYAAGLRKSVGERAAALNQRGGVVNGPMANIDAAKIMAFGQGLSSLEDLNQQLAQQKIANLLSFLTWSPPTATETKQTGFSFGIK